MAIKAFQSVGDAVSFDNATATGTAGVHLILQAAQQLGAHNARMNMMAESVFAGIVQRMATPDPVEAIATQKIMTGDDRIDYATVVALAQQLTKLAQTTPPKTP